MILAAAVLLALAQGPRQPVAIAQSGDHLYIANRLSGTVSVVNTRTRRVTIEKRIGNRLSDIASIPGSRRLIALDEGANRAILLGQDLSVVAQLEVPGTPVDVVVSADGTFCAISSLWARQVTLVTLDKNGFRKTRVIDLPFNPRLQLLVDGDRRLIVADSFGGHVAAIDVRRSTLVAVRTIEGHGIRGLALSHDGRRVRFAQMQIESHMPTSRESIAAGYLVGNLVRSVRVDLLTRPADTVEPVGQWQLESLGINKNAAGDPGPLAATAGGGMVICITGVDQVGLRSSRFAPLERIAVGRGPTALVIDKSRAYVANRFDDSISVVDIDARRVVNTISLGARVDETLIREGERLFYDARLSVHRWMSCHSCHVDGHTTGTLSDTFGDGTIRAPKRVLSLLGTAGTGPWGWNGSKTALREQVHLSLRTTMNVEDKNFSDRTAEALTAFIESLPAAPSITRARGVGPDAESARRGRAVFNRFECGRCHQPGTFTVNKVFDVGLRDEAGHGSFNPPSLRGVSQRARLFHDGRARSLREVITRFRHNDVEGITPGQIDDLLTYLRGL